MTKQHTPGPWGLAADDSVRSAGTKENGYLSEHICSLDHYRDDRVEQRASNARLIAAAPDLLEAAQRLSARGFFTPVSCADQDTLSDMALMRAAIAKATGENK